MLKKARISYALLPVLAVCLFTGILYLFFLRFNAGDVYPPYSSLRSDPLGAKGLFKGLHDLKTIEGARNFQPLSQWAPRGPATIFFLGSRTNVLQGEKTIQKLTQLAISGNRLVISFFPKTGKVREEQRPESMADDQRNKKQEGVKETKAQREALKEGEEEKDPYEYMSNAWGLGFAVKKRDPSSVAIKGKGVNALGLPRELTWHSDMYFEISSELWTPIYTVEDRPVVVEKRYGRGSLVLATDSYCLSNEALASDPEIEVISWLVGTNRHVIFDEWHLGGIQKSLGITSLAQKYGLEGVFISAIVCFLLFAWKKSAPLVPPIGEEDSLTDTGPSLGTRNYAEAMASLLRRNISQKELLDVCFSQWKKSSAKGLRITDQTLKEVEDLIVAYHRLPDRQKDPTQIYKSICRTLSERKAA